MNIYLLIFLCVAVPIGIAGIIIALVSGRKDKKRSESIDPNKPYHDFIKGLKN